MKEVFAGVAVMLTWLSQLMFHKKEKKEMCYYRGPVAFGILQCRKPNCIIHCQPRPDSAVSKIILVYAGPT
jgi:hypothetical protein